MFYQILQLLLFFNLLTVHIRRQLTTTSPSKSDRHISIFCQYLFQLKTLFSWSLSQIFFEKLYFRKFGNAFLYHNITKRAYILNKKDLRTLVGLYTGHCPLKYNRQRNLSPLQGSRWNGGTHNVYMRCYLPQKATISRKGESYAWKSCISCP